MACVAAYGRELCVCIGVWVLCCVVVLDIHACM